MIENILWIFEFLIATLQVSVDRMLFAVMHTRLFQCDKVTRAMITGHVKVFGYLIVGFGGNLGRSNGQRKIIAGITTLGSALRHQIRRQCITGIAYKKKILKSWLIHSKASNDQICYRRPSHSSGSTASESVCGFRSSSTASTTIDSTCFLSSFAVLQWAW